MFTGLIQEKAKILKALKDDSGLSLTLSRPGPFEQLKNGESIAVDGVCLTLTHSNSFSMDFYVGKETLDKSHFAYARESQVVNLERSLAFGDRLGGHMVSGHVDGVGRVVTLTPNGPSLGLEIEVRPQEFKSIITKGSLCVNGVSLTVNALDRDKKTVSLYLIPETLERTNLGALKVLDLVNIECDQFVKIIAQQVTHYMKEQNA
jgi:riboflavin synthase